MTSARFPAGAAVFISSTMVDLGPYRRAAQRALGKVGLVGVRLEQLWEQPAASARTASLAETVAEEIRKAAAMLVILGSRSGAFVEGTGLTFTQHELRAALGGALPVYVFATPGSGLDDAAGAASIPRADGDLYRRCALVRRVENIDQFEAAVEEVFRALVVDARPLTSVHIAPVDPALVKRLLESPEELARIPDRMFETLVAELLSADGWTVDLVVRPNAHGPDIVAFSTRFVVDVPLRLVVECKRYRADRPVGVREVRNLAYWVDQEFQATLGMLATTSYFTSDARRLATERHAWRLSLRDSSEITEWLRRTRTRGGDC